MFGPKVNIGELRSGQLDDRDLWLREFMLMSKAQEIGGYTFVMLGMPSSMTVSFESAYDLSSVRKDFRWDGALATMGDVASVGDVIGKAFGVSSGSRERNSYSRVPRVERLHALSTRSGDDNRLLDGIITLNPEPVLLGSSAEADGMALVREMNDLRGVTI